MNFQSSSLYLASNAGVRQPSTTNDIARFLKKDELQGNLKDKDTPLANI
jgi:hypothetical protein